VDEVLIFCRWLQFAAAMQLFGVGIFQSMLAPAPLARTLDPEFRRVAAVAILVVFVTTLGWLLLASGEIGDGWADTWNSETVSAVLFDTSFGHVWQWRLGFAVVLLGMLTFGRHDRWPIVAVLAALALGSLGLVGHAAMHSGALGWCNRLSQSLHLLAAGFWLGSLVPLVACLRPTGGAPLGTDISIALRRFSGLGYFAVATVLVTGVVNTWLVLGVWPVALSLYQELLIAKISLVLIMICLAVVNRYVLVPRLRGRPDSLRRLRRSTIGEIILGICVIGFVSVFGTLPPT
jgi:copper resistance protein D